MEREQFKAVAGMMHAAFPDVEVTIQDQIAEGDKVVTRWTAQVTHQGDFGEKPMGFSLRKLPGALRRGASRASRPRASG
jgi:predicted ester cyclase